MMEEPLLYLMYLLLGLVSGTAGGLIGIGGGAIVVPALTLVFHKDTHLAIAASLVQMIFVAASSAYGHYRNGYILKSVVARLVPLAATFAVIGAVIGSRVSARALQQVFALFLVYVAIDTTYKLIRNLIRRVPDEQPLAHFSPANEWTIPAVAVPMGFSCGVLGIGGGSIAVPMLHMFLRLPLKNAVANSSAAIFFSSIIAAIAKVLSLKAAMPAGVAIPFQWYDPIIVGLLLAPGSFVGGWIGARLVRISPAKIIQAIFIVVILYSAHEMWRKANKKPASLPTSAVEEIEAAGEESPQAP